MNVGDLVSLKRRPNKLFGIALRVFEIENKRLHKDPFPMVEVMTVYGALHIWKRRKLEVFHECR